MHAHTHAHTHTHTHTHTRTANMHMYTYIHTHTQPLKPCRKAAHGNKHHHTCRWSPWENLGLLSSFTHQENKNIMSGEISLSSETCSTNTNTHLCTRTHTQAHLCIRTYAHMQTCSPCNFVTACPKHNSRVLDKLD